MCRTFPKYTMEMYRGNEPSCAGHFMVDGGRASRWKFWAGSAETYQGRILTADFYQGPDICVFLCGNGMMITRILVKEVRQYTVNMNGLPTGCCIRDDLLKQMEDDEARRILNRKYENCKIWDMIRKRAVELLE